MPDGMGKKLENKCFAPRNTACERALSQLCAVSGNMVCDLESCGKESASVLWEGVTVAVRNSIDWGVGVSREGRIGAVSEAKTYSSSSNEISDSATDNSELESRSSLSELCGESRSEECESESIEGGSADDVELCSSQWGMNWAKGLAKVTVRCA